MKFVCSAAGLRRTSNDFLIYAFWRKISMTTKSVKGILIERHAIFRGWITVFVKMRSATEVQIRDRGGTRLSLMPGVVSG